MGWERLGYGVYRRHYDSLRLNIGAVVGENGVLVIDTRASHRQAAELLVHISELTTQKVRWVVNSHWHWDHTFGNAVFDGEIWGHARCRQRLLTHGEEARSDALSWMPASYRDELAEVMITPPAHTFSRLHHLDLGGRTATLEYLGRGHTDNDIIVTVPDASVVFAGDLVEEGSPPYFEHAYPLAWADTLARLVALGPETVIPGHGGVVDLVFVAEQRKAIGEVGWRARAGWAQGRPVEEVAGGGPFPPETMKVAVGRAYQELGGAI